ncbi:radical SAM protein [Pseudomonas syringae pv. actinidiae]|nr:radical SAM protein [Pseudomonas syringae pv. actinidiae]
MIYTVIAKPTKACNADCSYCSSPPDDANAWSIEDFKNIFDRVSPGISDSCYWIWHGGEPMLQGPDFYQEAYEYAIKTKPNINFSMQTNILLYKSKRWKSIFRDIFQGRISTSFDPEVHLRTIKGDAKKYETQFRKKLAEVLEDGFEPLVISVFNEANASKMIEMYDWASQSRGNTFHVRFNYQYPAGRASDLGDIIKPKTYGENLLEIYERWIAEFPPFDVVPLSQMLQKVIGGDVDQCPWTNSCGGKFLSIEPNGDLYNCGDFADLGDEKYRFGNAKNLTISGTKKENIVGFYRKEDPANFVKKVMSSPAVHLMSQRRVNVPSDCYSCRHYKECQGGCMRDAELYGRGLGGKFYYCESWKMVFDRIKSSILSGEADNLLTEMGKDVDAIKAHVYSYNQEIA